jgi:hypothetical protein
VRQYQAGLVGAIELARKQTVVREVQHAVFRQLTARAEPLDLALRCLRSEADVVGVRLHVLRYRAQLVSSLG